MEGVEIGYWAAQEEHSPSQLLFNVSEAEKGGFESAFTSDHFMPWFDRGAHAGFAWSWVAACAAQTKQLKLGTGVTAPDRYHPALIAQAFATLDDMFPGRVVLGLGAGEAMNSTPLGVDFPSPGQREERLKEALEIITGLWKGEFMDYPGFFYRLVSAKLYTPPKTKIPIFVAAGGKRTAELAGTYADGVIGFSGGKDAMNAAVDAAKKHGKSESDFGRLIEFKCSYDKDYQRALDSTRVWTSTMVKGILGSDLADPRKLQARGDKEVTDKDIESVWSIVTDVEDLIKPIEDLVQEGFNIVQVHSASPDEASFVHDFTSKALPHLQGESK
ncbi:MAG: TIGR03557 family F420-dependent LLM class oxidoreductase [Nitrososphaerota archaeon]|nr:TIGR03557 family F420-dependent LLM class oxidoreductase [Nitrososphaerota archaeon]